jgi:hypothetical protein
MSITLSVKTDHQPAAILHLVQSTLDAEITRLELALDMADRRLAPFEQKYQVSSEYFLTHWTAEDLDGRDDEYVQWAGEYRLKQRLLEKLQYLREIQYDHPDVLRSNEYAD